jgi:hypothetical protein
LEKERLVSSGDTKDISLTAKYGITSDLILDGTYNPDFSQVESDAGQIDFNLRYALFFPEKRPFFLEGLEKYNFGGFDHSDPLQEVVHTRMIVNPLLGFKLNGKVSAKNTLAAIYAMDDLPAGSEEDYAHFTIFRYKRALAKDSFIGGFYTGRERSGGYNRLVGADGQVRLSPSTVVGFHLFGSKSGGKELAPKDQGHALSLHYFYTSRNWLVMMGLQDIGKDFRTETGYVTRTGLTRFRSGVLRMFYPKSGIIQRIEPMVHVFYIRDKFSGLNESSSSVDLRFRLLRNSMVAFGCAYSSEVFFENKFSTNRARFIASSQITKQLFFSVSYYYRNKIRYVADPYQGKGNDASVSVTFLPTENLHFDLSLVYSDFTRSSDSKKEYDYTIFRGKTTYQINKYLFIRGIIEYNSFHKRLMTDFLASFTYIPGTVIHLGYGSLYEKIRWENGIYEPANDFIESRRGFFFKASYLWRW